MPDSTVSRIKSLLSAGNPDLGPGPRIGILPEAQLNASLEPILGGAKLSADAGACVRALVLLWHDHLDAAHGIVQDMGNRDGSFIHGILHRREPDYGNAKYWFHRVGDHPCFAEIARRVAGVEFEGGAAREKLVAKGGWDAFAFIDACAAAMGRSGTEPERDSLRQVQAAEMESLLEWIVSGGT